MLCENCKTKIPTLKTRLVRVNDELFEAGKIYWDTMSEALRVIENALTRHGFALPEGNEYLQVINFRCHTEVGEGKYLTATFYRMESGRYEVIAYVN